MARDRHRLSLALGSAPLLAAAACSALVSTSGLTGGGASGGLDAGDGAFGDVAPAQDVTSDGDGGEAGPDATSFCEPGPNVFCEDFEGAGIAVRWDEENRQDSADIFVDDAMSVSPHHSLALSLTKNAASSCAYSNIGKLQEGSFDATRSVFSVHVAGPAALLNEVVQTQSIEVPGGACSVLTLLVWNGLAFDIKLLEQLASNGALVDTVTHETGQRLEANVWTRLEVTADYASDRATVRSPSGETVIPFALPCPHAPSRARSFIGFHCVGSSTASLRLQAHFDDVLFAPRVK